ncbi:MAG: hypothetical protein OXF55_03190 [Caldilineaceae bacterium]|nr:hypothetical protein [Caldilineaceae bacterium]MDE0080042.1 hypothetical protein [Caldilineaceae bacterium]
MEKNDDEVDMAAMNAAIDKVLAYDSRPRTKQERDRAQRKDRQSSSVKESKSSYKTSKS